MQAEDPMDRSWDNHRAPAIGPAAGDRRARDGDALLFDP